MNDQSAIQSIITHLKRFKWNTMQTGGRSLCPFHEDRTPSFGISFTKKMYHCFSCNAKGSLSKLYRHLGLGFLPASFKIEYEEILEDREINILELFQNYKDGITNPLSKPERYIYDHSYLEFRGINNIIKDRFLIRYDIEKNALFAPIINNKGVIVANFRRFQNPMVGQKINYSKFFKPFEILYGEHLYAGQKTIILVEGILGMVTTYNNLLELNLLDSIFPLSTYSCNNFNDKHIKKFLEMDVKYVIPLLDPDFRGQKGIENIKEQVKKLKKIEFIYPNYEYWPAEAGDPNELFPLELETILKNC